jgi:hypothetical protein
VTDSAELARLEVVEILAVRWARVVVSRSAPLPAIVSASRELRALLGNGSGKSLAGRGGDDGSGLGNGVGSELDALYGPPVAV